MIRHIDPVVAIALPGITTDFAWESGGTVHEANPQAHFDH